MVNPRRGILSQLGDRQVWVSIILLFLVLEIIVLSLERARWITPQPSLTVPLVISVVLAWLLASSRLPGVLTHFIAFTVGAGLTALQTFSLFASETMAFAVFLSFLIWLMGYFSMWYLIRRRNPWIAVCLGTVVIIINLSNLPEDYYYFFGLYFTAVIFLIVWMRMVKQNNVSGHTIGFSKRSLIYLSSILLCIIVVGVTLARVVPEMRIPQVQTFVASNMLWKQDLEDSFFNLFAKVPSKEALNTSLTRQDLEFGKVWKEEERIDFIIDSPKSSYWRIKVYDTYTSRGWANHPVSDSLLAKGESWDGSDTASSGEIIIYTVTTNIKTDAVLTAGSYISADTNVLVSVTDEDIISVATPRVLSPGERYTVTTIVSAPSPEVLSLVGEEYPSSISHQYLQLPADFPNRIRELSKEVVGDAETPYQKLMAIDDYLSQFPYEKEIEELPEGIDGVEYFIYTQKSGFCLYFASAMAVMLRSVDVPTRLAVGYVPGEFGEREGEYILRNKHYHAWPQVYFTSYGWVDIEATPSVGDSQVASDTPIVATGNPVEPRETDVAPIWDSTDYWLQSYGFPPEEPEVIPWTPPGRFSFTDELNQTLLIISIIIAVLLLLLIARLVFRSVFYRWLWRLDREHLASSMYSKMCQIASMVGLGPEPQQTPQEFANTLAVEFPDQTADLNTIVQNYVGGQFSPRKGRLGLMEEASVLNARQNVFTVLLQRLGILRALRIKIKKDDTC